MKTLLWLALLITSAVSANAEWLPRKIHEVRAYYYDCSQEEGNLSLLKNGKLHKGIINNEGAKLTDEQIERLKKALESSEKRMPGAFCYMPHHGFVFFDADGKAMGHIELCFTCGNVDSSPKGLPDNEWNWKEMRKILEELKIPILEDFTEYSKLYEAKNKK
jgi:hypothetical protein